MALKLFGKKEKTDNNFMEMTPYPIHKHEINDEGLVDVLVPKFTNKFMVKITKNIKSPYIRANFDELGSAVWLLIDGKAKVYEIADKLTEEFGEKIHPVNERLLMHLTSLYHKGLISFNELKGKNNG